MKAPSLIWLWPASIVAVWITIAVLLDQPIWHLQQSRELVAHGAFKGDDLTIRGWWKLITSQWLHVTFAHMMLNAIVIGFVGQALRSRLTLLLTLAIGIVGGAIGQLASALARPEAFISGASQAEFALCGAALVLLGLRSWGWRVAVIGLAVGVALDLAYGDRTGIKVGHLAGFGAGIIAAILVSIRERRAIS